MNTVSFKENVKSISKQLWLQKKKIFSFGKLKRQVKGYFNRIALKNRDFHIISNNCWGGAVYDHYYLPYTTPFVGLLVYGPDYIKLLEHLDFYLEQKLKFITTENSPYPIALLHDVKLEFVHYKNDKEAKEKWERRLKRLDKSNLIVKISEMHGVTPALLEKFNQLPYANKITLVFKDYPNKDYITVNHKKRNQWENEGKTFYEVMDVTKWLNSLAK